MTVQVRGSSVAPAFSQNPESLSSAFNPFQAQPVTPIPCRHGDGEKTSTATYYIDEALNIIQENGGIVEILRTPSTGLPGKVVDWFLSYFIDMEDGTKAAATLSKHSNSGRKLLGQGNRGYRTPQWTWLGERNFNCNSPDMRTETPYTQRWFAKVKSSPGQDLADIPDSLQDSFIECLNDEVIEPYFDEVSKLAEEASCQFERTVGAFQLRFSLQNPTQYNFADPINSLELEILGGYPLSNNPIIQGQSALYDSRFQSRANQCLKGSIYRAALDVPKINMDYVKYFGMMDAIFRNAQVGIQIFSENWHITYPQFVFTSNLLPRDCFLKKYGVCLVERFVVPYFKKIDQDKLEAASKYNHTGWHHITQFTKGGNFQVQAYGGLPPSQLAMELPEDPSETCFKEAWTVCKTPATYEHKKTIVAFVLTLSLILGSTSLYIMVMVFKSARDCIKKRQ